MEEMLYALLRSGLWSRPESLPAGSDWEALRLTAEAQTVAAVVADGIGQNLPALKAGLPKLQMKLLSALVMGTELFNQQMNAFLKDLMRDLAEAGIRAVVVKGQGVAQFYPVPLHRQVGDIDLLVARADFARAEQWLLGRADRAFDKEEARLHEAFTFGEMTVELHGCLDTGISVRVDRFLDGLQASILASEARLWDTVPVPGGYEQLLYVFVHLVQHFFLGGVGLRQLCDWAVLLHIFAAKLDTARLEADLRAMDLLREWRILGAFLVEKLGLPEAEMPLYEPCSAARIERISRYVFRVGNMGKNIDRSYFGKDPYWVRKGKSLWLMTRDFFEQVRIVPHGARVAMGRRLRTSFRTVMNDKQ